MLVGIILPDDLGIFYRGREGEEWWRVAYTTRQKVSTPNREAVDNNYSLRSFYTLHERLRHVILL